MNHYETLGVPRDASAQDIKKAWRKKASDNHPDREGGDPEQMAAINRAYEVLSHTEKRAQYDETGTDGPAPKTLDQQARELLLMIFDHMLNEEPSGLVVPSARDALCRNRRTIENNQRQIKSVLDRIAKQEGKVRCKSGDNLVEQLLQSRRSDAESKLRQMDEALRIQSVAEQLIGDYECDEAPPVSSLFASPGPIGATFNIRR